MGREFGGPANANSFPPPSGKNPGRGGEEKKANSRSFGGKSLISFKTAKEKAWKSLQKAWKKLGKVCKKL
jgi:hypothetical protein